MRGDSRMPMHRNPALDPEWVRYRDWTGPEIDAFEATAPERPARTCAIEGCAGTPEMKRKRCAACRAAREDARLQRERERAARSMAHAERIRACARRRAEKRAAMLAGKRACGCALHGPHVATCRDALRLGAIVERRECA